VKWHKVLASALLFLTLLDFPALGQTSSGREKLKAARSLISANSNDPRVSSGPTGAASRAWAAATVARACKTYPSAIAGLLKAPVSRPSRRLQTDTRGRELRGIDETQRRIDSRIRDMRGMVERIKRLDRRLMR